MFNDIQALFNPLFGKFYDILRFCLPAGCYHLSHNKSVGTKIMTTLSLNQVMNSMANNAGEFHIKEAAPRCVEDAFSKIDGIFASLQKSHKNALAYYQRLKKTKGRDDPMAEIAADMVESTLSAMQTRMIEIRANKALMLQARKYIQQAIMKAEKERRLQSTLYKARLFAMYKTDLIQDYKERKQNERVRFLIFVLWLFVYAMDQAQMKITINNDFAMATARGDTKAA